MPQITDTHIRMAVMGLEISLAISLMVWIRMSVGNQRGHWLFFLKLLTYGGLMALVCAYVEIKFSFDIHTLQATRPDLMAKYGVIYQLINTFSASATEELAKYVAAAFSILNAHRIRKLSDAIVYLIIIGLGFSLVEDLFFVLNPEIVAPYRLLSFYVHSGTSAVIGYSLGRFMSGVGKYSELLVAIFGAIALHFTYNLSTVIGGDFALPFTIAITIYISLQIFILFRKAVEEEYRLGHRFRVGTTQRLLNLVPKPKA